MVIKTTSLKGNYVFKKIIKQGRYCSNNNIVIYVMYNNTKLNKIGICVSKKNGNSVQRNKIKRWVREIYKNNEATLNSGLNIIVLFKKSAKYEYMSYELLKMEISKCIKELKIGKNVENEKS